MLPCENVRNKNIKTVDQNRKSRRKSHGQKSYSRHKKEKVRKGKICRSHLKRIKNASEYIGAERLTTQVGFFTKGKISNSISRLEKFVPDDIKARADQDLHKVLKFANGSKSTYHRPRVSDVKSSSGSSSNMSFQKVSCGSKVPLLTSPVKNFTRDSWKAKLEKSIGTVSSKSVFSSVKLTRQYSPMSNENEIFEVHKIVINKLYPAVKKANKLLYPGISNNDQLKRELMDLRYKFSSVSLTNSSSARTDVCNFSANSSENETSEDKNDFVFKPVLMQDSFDVKDFAKFFPIVESNSSSESSEIDVQQLSSFKNTSLSDCNVHNNKGYKAISNKHSYIDLILGSPSPGGSPVWKPQVDEPVKLSIRETSPMKFEPDLPPTPNFYYRKKMF